MINTFFWEKETRNGDAKKQEIPFAIVQLLCVYPNIQVYWITRFILLLNIKKDCLVQNKFKGVSFVNIFGEIPANGVFQYQNFL